MSRFTITQTPSGPTLFDSQAGECYKSRHSARVETEHVFFLPGVQENPHFGKKPFRILELGFGLGTNFEHLREKALSLQLISIERDLAGARFFEEHFPNPALGNLLAAREYKEGNFETRILEDDFFSALPALKESFHCIYFDPFSPKANPEAWTLELFRHCFRLLIPGGRLVTYSVSRVAKDAAAQAGFQVTKRDLPAELNKHSALLAIRP
jgi:tRNA U34 5-methylaminomethyl-2-thiouridine-forming methyltransferase MnmC